MLYGFSDINLQHFLVKNAVDVANFRSFFRCVRVRCDAIQLFITSYLRDLTGGALLCYCCVLVCYTVGNFCWMGAGGT